MPPPSSLDPSAAPFRPSAYHHRRPHNFRRPSHKPVAIRILPPRLMLAPPRQRPSTKPQLRCFHGHDTKLRWMPKFSKIEEDDIVDKTEKPPMTNSDVVADQKDVEAADEAVGLGGSTTVMMRHLPNMLKRRELIEMLDEHCREVNRGAVETRRSEYDFVYLPIDYQKKGNKGYAFINFTTPEAAVAMLKAFHGMKWEIFGSRSRPRPWRFRTKKICHICPAAVQGKKNLEATFSGRKFPLEEFQPVTAMSSPRDGINEASLTPVGYLC